MHRAGLAPGLRERLLGAGVDPSLPISDATLEIASPARRNNAAFRAAHPDHIALTYINCSTEVKALSDVIVTSSSAETILAQIPPEQKII